MHYFKNFDEKICFLTKDLLFLYKLNTMYCIEYEKIESRVFALEIRKIILIGILKKAFKNNTIYLKELKSNNNIVKKIAELKRRQEFLRELLNPSILN